MVYTSIHVQNHFYTKYFLNMNKGIHAGGITCVARSAREGTCSCALKLLWTLRLSFFPFPSFFGFNSHQCTVHHIGFKRTTAHCAFYQPFIPLKSSSFVRARAAKKRLFGVARESARRLRLFPCERAERSSL